MCFFFSFLFPIDAQSLVNHVRVSAQIDYEHPNLPHIKSKIHWHDQKNIIFNNKTNYAKHCIEL